LPDLLPVQITSKEPKDQDSKQGQQNEFVVFSQGWLKDIKKRQYFIRNEKENSGFERLLGLILSGTFER
jgi:hypothetical protein